MLNYLTRKAERKRFGFIYGLTGLTPETPIAEKKYRRDKQSLPFGRLRTLYFASYRVLKAIIRPLMIPDLI